MCVRAPNVHVLLWWKYCKRGENKPVLLKKSGAMSVWLNKHKYIT